MKCLKVKTKYTNVCGGWSHHSVKPYLICWYFGNLWQIFDRKYSSEV